MSVIVRKNSSNDERSVNPAATANNQTSGLNGVASDDADTKEIWDLLPLPDLYSTVVEIYRKGTSTHLKTVVLTLVCTVKDQIKMDYHNRVLLLAYYKQEKYGSYGPEKDTNTGYFDLVGSDRR